MNQADDIYPFMIRNDLVLANMNLTSIEKRLMILNKEKSVLDSEKRALDSELRNATNQRKIDEIGKKLQIVCTKLNSKENEITTVKDKKDIAEVKIKRLQSKIRHSGL